MTNIKKQECIINAIELKTINEIDLEKIESWNVNDIVTISAGTGAGKSYFIKNTLYNLAKGENVKILMLIHRENCAYQFKEEIERDGKSDTIDIKTYQKLEYKELHNLGNSLKNYKYIVCDEFHYFLSDARFNYTTDISMNLILEQTHAIKIFMSATSEGMLRYLNGFKKIKTTNYSIPISFNFINTLHSSIRMKL